MKKISAILLAMLLGAASFSLAQSPGVTKAKMGTVKGRLIVDGKPLSQAIVSFFNTVGGPPPEVGTARRVPDMVSRTDDNGGFFVKLLPGIYNMGALVRERGKGPGPPRVDENFYFIRDSSNHLKDFTIITKQVTEAGQVKGVQQRDFVEFKSFMTISGAITNENGQPFKGAFVVVRKNLNDQRPKYIAEPTEKNGLYEFKLPPGSYYVMAMDSLRSGRPLPGAYVGTYGKSAPVGEVIAANAGGAWTPGLPPGVIKQGGSGEAINLTGMEGQKISGVDIQMFKIPNQEETRKKFEEEAKARAREVPVINSIRKNN